MRNMKGSNDNEWMRAYIHVFVNVCVCMYGCVRMCVSECIYNCMYAGICVNICCVRMYVCYLQSATHLREACSDITKSLTMPAYATLHRQGRTRKTKIQVNKIKNQIKNEKNEGKG